jgi:hypothetical protein
MLNYTDRENLEVGQRVYLFYGNWRHDNSRYTMPLPIISTTKTQFTVAAENMDSRPKRFMKSNGHEVGHAFSSSSPSVTLVTSASTREVNNFNNKKKTDARKQATKEQQEEASLREKYNAVWVDDDIQERFLKPLRTMAENGEKEMSELLKSFDGVTLEAENFYRITDAVDRETRNGCFSFGLKVRDYARNQHQRFIDVIEEFQTGTRYKIGKVEVTNENASMEELLLAVTQQVLGEQMGRFFDYTFSNTVVDEADQKFISTLREIVRDDDRAPRVTKIKEEDNA